MKQLIIVFLATTLLQPALAQDMVYASTDSIFIENILKETQCKEFSSPGDMIIDIAEKFIGKEYVAGTLDCHHNEPLVISSDKLDCTTFVELIFAMVITAKENDCSFGRVCSNLEKIRYREGARNGYASRLHYISWWIDDNSQLELLCDVTNGKWSREQVLELNFMSTHTSNYEQLKENPTLTAQIEEQELPYRGVAVNYIPKEYLDKKKEELDIENGDIIALVTNIAGLDVTHIGFAFWKNGELHLLHASSSAGKVIRDDNTLFNYQKRRNSHIGIRVFRIQ